MERGHDEVLMQTKPAMTGDLDDRLDLSDDWQEFASILTETPGDILQYMSFEDVCKKLIELAKAFLGMIEKAKSKENNYCNSVLEAALRSQIRALEVENAELKAKLNEKTSIRKNVEAELTKMESSIGQDKAEHLRKQIEELECKQKERVSIQKNVEANLNETEVKSSQQTILKLKENVKKLLDKLKEEISIRKKMESNLQEIGKQSLQLSDEVAQLREKINMLSDKLNEVECKRRDIKKKYEELMDEFRSSQDFLIYSNYYGNFSCGVCGRMIGRDRCVHCYRKENSHDDDSCGHQFMKMVIIKTHPYSKAILLATCGKDNSARILDLQDGYNWLKPSDCKWRHLCYACDSATSVVEEQFKDHLDSVQLRESKFTKIRSDYADLFYVYTFRALRYNVNILHYQKRDEGGCSCDEIYDSLKAFLKRARHLSQPAIWKERKNEDIAPAEAGMVFLTSRSTPEHCVEFPIICKINLKQTFQDVSFVLIFAQVPPFYWAFPLPLDCHNTDLTILKSSKTAKEIVTAQIKSEAEQLANHFEVIVEKINKVLQDLRDRIREEEVDKLKKKMEVLNKKIQHLNQPISKYTYTEVKESPVECSKESENCKQLAEKSKHLKLAFESQAKMWEAIEKTEKEIPKLTIGYFNTGEMPCYLKLDL